VRPVAAARRARPTPDEVPEVAPLDGMPVAALREQWRMAAAAATAQAGPHAECWALAVPALTA
jgi:hypothetical protein